MKLAGKYALVTGGSQGLGKAIAQAFLNEGASVMICGRNKNDLSLAQEELGTGLQEPQTLATQPADVGKEEDANRLIDSVLNHFPRLDILVNNAGIYGPKGRLEENNWREWVQTLQINFLGAVFLCKKILPHFKKSRYGKIVNLSGGGATNPLPRLSAYAASKVALVRFTETLAQEVQDDGIDVNAIAPGALDTRLLDEILEAGPGKVGGDFFKKCQKLKEDGGVPLEQGAELAVFLASDASDGITGKLISAVWDPWRDFPQHLEELKSSDIYTLRRIVPKERGMDWGNVEP